MPIRVVLVKEIIGRCLWSVINRGHSYSLFIDSWIIMNGSKDNYWFSAFIVNLFGCVMCIIAECPVISSWVLQGYMEPRLILERGAFILLKVLLGLKWSIFRAGKNHSFHCHSGLCYSGGQTRWPQQLMLPIISVNAIRAFLVKAATRATGPLGWGFSC